MPTQEERLSTLEQTVTVLGKGIRDLNHHATILLGVTSEQGKDIREMKVSLAALGEHLDTFEQSVNYRFETLEQGVNGRFETLEQGVNGRFETLEQSFNGRFETLEQGINSRFETLEQGVNGRFETLEQGVNGRFETLEQGVNGRFEEQGKKLDQIVLLLNKFAPKAE